MLSVGVYASIWKFYRGGVFNPKWCGIRPNHAVNIVGYGTDEDSGLDYWLIRNSWGPDWGENGYIRLFKSLDKGPGKCKVNTDATYPTED